MINCKTMPRRGRCGPCLLLSTMTVLLLGVSAAVGQKSDPTTAARTGPKGRMPILVLTDSKYPDNPFGCYLTEILRGEGLVEFEQAERSVLLTSSIEKSSSKSGEQGERVLAGGALARTGRRLRRRAAGPEAFLSAYGVVVMAEMELNAGEEQLLRKYVCDGGVLIAMRPDADLADLFGVRVRGQRTERLLQYFAVDADAPAARGVVEATLQYHGQAANYELDGATPLAHLYDDANTPSSNPAVTVNRSGSGQAVAFAFDLARSVVLMRQGNPEWQNTEGDDVSGYRPLDLFVRPDGRVYCDTEHLKIPQADEKQRFLANIITRLMGKPLPRMWYLPGMHKTMMINAGDGESNYGPQISPVLDACASYGGSFTVYLMSRGIELTTLKQEADWRAAGHEVGVHMYGGGPEGAGAYDALQKAYAKIVADLKSKFGHGSRTARNHTLDWTGWVDMAAIEAEFGTSMDLNYIHLLWDASPRNTYGYPTGTGLPQRFIDAQGRLLPIYQATTHWADEFFVYSKTPPDEAAEIIIKMFEAAQGGYYSAFVNGIHPCRFNGYGGRDKITPVWPHKVWAYCREQGIPSWSAEKLLDFLQARNKARFENVTWLVDPKQNTSQLAFEFRTPAEGQDLTIMIPSRWSARVLKSVAAGGKTVKLSTETIKGIEYGMFTTKAAVVDVQARYAPAG